MPRREASSCAAGRQSGRTSPRAGNVRRTASRELHRVADIDRPLEVRRSALFADRRLREAHGRERVGLEIVQAELCRHRQRLVGETNRFSRIRCGEKPGELGEHLRLRLRRSRVLHELGGAQDVFGSGVGRLPRVRGAPPGGPLPRPPAPASLPRTAPARHWRARLRPHPRPRRATLPYWKRSSARSTPSAGPSVSASSSRTSPPR